MPKSVRIFTSMVAKKSQHFVMIAYARIGLCGVWEQGSFLNSIVIKIYS